MAKLDAVSGPASGLTRITIEGTGLASVTSVKFGDVEATGLTPDPQSPDTKLAVVSPPHIAGTVPVTVTSRGGTSAGTQTTRFTYVADPGAGLPGDGSGGAITTPAPPAPTPAPPAPTSPAPTPPAPAPLSPAPQPAGPGAAAPLPAAPLGVAPVDRAEAAARAAEARRALGLRRCLSSARRRKNARRPLTQRRCLTRHGRTPGRITGLSARMLASRKAELSFRAPGSDRTRPPAARSYMIRQSLRPIRNARDFKRAQVLCRGTCRFGRPVLGQRLKLKITGLRPKTTFYYAVAARDNVSGRLGPRSPSVRIRTR